MVVGSSLGIVVALMRLSRVFIVRAFATLYTEVFRTLPLLVVLYWVYSSLPAATGLALPAFGAAVLGFSLNEGAYQAENFRAGILSISPAQRNAGLALGMTDSQVMRRIILPQAIVRIIPLLGTEWVALFKNTSLVAVIAVEDLMYQARMLSINTFRPLEILTTVALIYYIIVFPQARLVEVLYRRYLPTER